MSIIFFSLFVFSSSWASSSLLWRVRLRYLGKDNNGECCHFDERTRDKLPFRHSLEQTLHFLALSIVNIKVVAVRCHRRRYSFLAWTARLPVLLKGTLRWKSFRGLCFFGNLLQGAVQDLIAQVDDVVVLVRCEDLKEEILEP